MPTTFPYFPNVPNAPDDPADDQPQMQVNTLSIQNLIAIDHVGFNTSVQGVNNSGGYHTIVHQDIGLRTRSGVGATFSNFPVGIPNINQIFTALYTPDTTGASSDTQLFNKTGNGGVNFGISQLTGNVAGNANEADGWQWIGGVLLQWGLVNFSGSPGFPQQTGTVTFKDRVTGAIPFPNFCYAVTATLHSLGATGNAQTLGVFTLTKGSFKWNYTGSSAYDRFYWIAIGS